MDNPYIRLTQAQGTNDADRASYSHGVFERDPSVS
jgi:hypothetical protein